MRNKIIIWVAGVLLYCGGLAQAEPITIQISGNVTSASGSALPSTIYKDVTFTGTYTYDSSAIVSAGGHHWQDAPYGITLSLGGYQFETAPNQIGQFDMWIMNDYSANGVMDYYLVRSFENISTSSLGLTDNSIIWEILDTTHTALSSDALPVTAPSLANWDYNVLEISGYGNGGLTIWGTVTQATLVPEPVTGILMAMGVFFLKRRR